MLVTGENLLRNGEEREDAGERQMWRYKIKESKRQKQKGEGKSQGARESVRRRKGETKTETNYETGIVCYFGHIFKKHS